MKEEGNLDYNQIKQEQSAELLGPLVYISENNPKFNQKRPFSNQHLSTQISRGRSLNSGISNRKFLMNSLNIQKISSSPDNNASPLRVCQGCKTLMMKTSQGKLVSLNSLRLNDQSRDSDYKKPKVRFYSAKPLINHMTSTIKQGNDYLKLSIKSQPQKPLMRISASLPSAIRHSKKFSQKQKKAVQKQIQRKQALKLIPRKKRKKIVYKVTPEEPQKFKQPYFQFKIQSLKKDRKMINFRMEQKSKVKLDINNNKIEDTINQLLKKQRCLRPAILTNL